MSVVFPYESLARSAISGYSHFIADSPQERLSKARAEFNAYLEKQAPKHFVNVESRA